MSRRAKKYLKGQPSMLACLYPRKVRDLAIDFWLEQDIIDLNDDSQWALLVKRIEQLPVGQRGLWCQKLDVWKKSWIEHVDKQLPDICQVKLKCYFSDEMEKDGLKICSQRLQQAKVLRQQKFGRILLSNDTMNLNGNMANIAGLPGSIGPNGHGETTTGQEPTKTCLSVTNDLTAPSKCNSATTNIVEDKGFKRLIDDESMPNETVNDKKKSKTGFQVLNPESPDYYLADLASCSVPNQPFNGLKFHVVVCPGNYMDVAQRAQTEILIKLHGGECLKSLKEVSENDILVASTNETFNTKTLAGVQNIIIRADGIAEMVRGEDLSFVERTSVFSRYTYNNSDNASRKLCNPIHQLAVREPTELVSVSSTRINRSDDEEQKIANAEEDSRVSKLLPVTEACASSTRTRNPGLTHETHQGGVFKSEVEKVDPVPHISSSACTKNPDVMDSAPGSAESAIRDDAQQNKNTAVNTTSRPIPPVTDGQTAPVQSNEILGALAFGILTPGQNSEDNDLSLNSDDSVSSQATEVAAFAPNERNDDTEVEEKPLLTTGKICIEANETIKCKEPLQNENKPASLDTETKVASKPAKFSRLSPKDSYNADETNDKKHEDVEWFGETPNLNDKQVRTRVVQVLLFRLASKVNGGVRSDLFDAVQSKLENLFPTSPESITLRVIRGVFERMDLQDTYDKLHQEFYLEPIMMEHLKVFQGSTK